MKKTILFDLDGTLIDSTNAIISCFYYSFKELNFNFIGCENDIKKYIGYPLEVMYKELGVPNNLIINFVTSYKSEYRKISKSKTTLLPCTVKSLELASSFARIGIVTTKTTLYTIPLLRHLNIMHYFEAIIGRQEVTYPKPHPEPILKCLKLMNLNPDKNIFMVGDTKLDIIAGNKSGINSIGVLCGYGEKDDLTTYTPYVVNNSLEAVQLIHNI